MAPDAAQCLVWGLNGVVGIVVAGQALRRGRSSLRDSPNGIHNDRQTQPDKVKASGRLPEAYAPGYHARNGMATHVLKQNAR
jgi:hypothetical protein